MLGKVVVIGIAAYLIHRYLETLRWEREMQQRYRQLYLDQANVNRNMTRLQEYLGKPLVHFDEEFVKILAKIGATTPEKV